MYYNLALSKNCPINDPRVLMYEYKLPAFLEIKEMSDIRDAIDEADDLDNQPETEK